MNSVGLVEHFFRHEYGRICALLSCRFGVQHINVVEDAVQSALLTAIQSWGVGFVPDNPSAWLYRVAHNHLVSQLRSHVRQDRLAREHALENDVATTDAASTSDATDELLQMLFVACDESIPIESQLVFALKTLCGFDIKEIADRLFISEANAYKRFGRAKEHLRNKPSMFEIGAPEYHRRLPTVHAVIYLLFTEGYLSSHPVAAIRKELCDEAIRLGTLLTQRPAGQTPETYALLALMTLHSSREKARQDATGGLVLLEEQNRALWDQEKIALGLAWLAKSAEGDVFTRYHAEAGVAAEHCLAQSLQETNWERVVECYMLLERIAPSPLHTLNRALATAEWKSPRHGLALLDGLVPPTWLEGSYVWSATLSDLHRRCGNKELAFRHRELALHLAPTDAVKNALGRRLRQENDYSSQSAFSAVS